MSTPDPVCYVRTKIKDGTISLFFDVPGTEPGLVTLSPEQVKSYIGFMRFLRTINPSSKKNPL